MRRSDEERGRGVDRRTFLRSGAAAGLAVGLLPLERVRAATLPAVPRVQAYRTLGRTGLRAPDIGFGSYKLDGDVALVHHALDRGVTHFDTAEGYMDGHSEETFGRALRGRRHEVTITSKHRAGANEYAESQMRALEGSLRRLQTDFLDIYLNHAVNDIARVSNPEWHEFVAGVVRPES